MMKADITLFEIEQIVELSISSGHMTNMQERSLNKNLKARSAFNDISSSTSSSNIPFSLGDAGSLVLNPIPPAWYPKRLRTMCL